MDPATITAIGGALTGIGGVVLGVFNTIFSNGQQRKIESLEIRLEDCERERETDNEKILRLIDGLAKDIENGNGDRAAAIL